MYCALYLNVSAQLFETLNIRWVQFCHAIFKCDLRHCFLALSLTFIFL